MPDVIDLTRLFLAMSAGKRDGVAAKIIPYKRCGMLSQTAIAVRYRFKFTIRFLFFEEGFFLITFF